MKPGKSHFRIIALQQRGASAFSVFVFFFPPLFFNKLKQNKKKKKKTFLSEFLSTISASFFFFFKRALDHCHVCSFLGIFQVSRKKKRELFVFLVHKSTVSLEPKKRKNNNNNNDSNSRKEKNTLIMFFFFCLPLWGLSSVLKRRSVVAVAIFTFLVLWFKSRSDKHLEKKKETN